MRILALDLGTACGWAAGSPDSRPLSGVLDLRPGRYSGGGMRFVRFRSALRDLLQGIELVAFEEVRRHLGVDAAHVYGGLLAVLTEECESRSPKIPYEGVPVATIKRHATGRGNADKDAMTAAACRKWTDRAIADDNESDALWLLDYSLFQHSPLAARISPTRVTAQPVTTLGPRSLFPGEPER